MNFFAGPFAGWLAVTISLLFLLIILGTLKMRYARTGVSDEKIDVAPSPVEMLVPLTGVFPHQDETLTSLLEQTHPCYQVVFILESPDDPAESLVSRLCERYSHAREVISGRSESCGQKNHSLIAGIRSLKPETKIIVICDSTNKADPRWLMRFTRPLETSRELVVTTFRAFHPQPETVGGVCQAIYASFLLLLIVLHPAPWGGATAVRRETLEKLYVAEAWSRTVVDDLVLGNVLNRAGIEVTMDPRVRLESPLANQTLSGFLGYLDRQILFPKFTNPGIWASSLICHLNTTAAILVSFITGLLLFPAGLVTTASAIASYGFLGCMLMIAFLLRRLNPFSISIRSWLIAFCPCVFLAAFIFFRSMFRDSITWHGRTYWVGAGGIVLKEGPQGDQRPVTGSLVDK